MTVPTTEHDTTTQDHLGLLDLDLDLVSMAEKFVDDGLGGVILASTMPIPGCP